MKIQYDISSIDRVVKSYCSFEDSIIYSTEDALLFLRNDVISPIIVDSRQLLSESVEYIFSSFRERYLILLTKTRAHHALFRLDEKLLSIKHTSNIDSYQQAFGNQTFFVTGNGMFLQFYAFNESGQICKQAQTEFPFAAASLSFNDCFADRQQLQKFALTYEFGAAQFVQAEKYVAVMGKSLSVDTQQQEPCANSTDVRFAKIIYVAEATFAALFESYVQLLDDQFRPICSLNLKAVGCDLLFSVERQLLLVRTDRSLAGFRVINKHLQKCFKVRIRKFDDVLNSSFDPENSQIVLQSKHQLVKLLLKETSYDCSLKVFGVLVLFLLAVGMKYLHDINIAVIKKL